jgi:WD40 repeat protein
VTFVNEFTPGQALSLVKDVQKAVIRLDDFSLSRELFEVIPESSSILLFPKMIGGFNRTNSLRIFEIQGESFRFLNEILVGTNAILHRGSRDMDFADSTQERLVAWGEEEQDSPVASIHFASIDPPTRRWHWTSGLHRAAPIEFSPDGQLVLLIGMGSEGRIMEVREVKTGKLRMHSEHALVFPPKAKFADGGRKLVVVGKDTKTEVTKVIFWDVTQPEKPPIEFTEPGLSRKLTVSPNGRWVGTGSDTGIVSIYDMETLTRNPNLVRGSSAVYGLDFSADSRSLISGFKGSEAVKVWQVETGQELLVFPADEYAISRLSFVEEGNTILAGSSGRTNSWQLWRAPTWAEINAAEANRKAENRSP